MQNRRLNFQQLPGVRSENFSSMTSLIVLFQILALSLVLFYQIEHITIESLLFALGLVITNIVGIILIRKLTRGDNYLLMMVNMLFTIGVIMIYRIEPSMGQRQLVVYLGSIIAFFVVYLVLRRTYQFWQGRTWLYYGLTVAMFAITLIFGYSLYGAQNWIEIAGIQVQPSEFAKIPFVFFVASWYQKYDDNEHNWKYKISLMVAVYVLIALFFLQRELGTAIVFFLVLISTQVAYEKDWRLIAANLGLAILGLFLAYFLFDHIKVRFDIWSNPWQDYNDKGYQIIQSLFAIAEGGFFGTGIGLGRPGMIPLGHSDFIFAAIIEEMGGFMGICIILLYALLVYRGFKIALKQEKDFYSVLALSISCLFAAQAFIMFAGVMKVIPLTGITIPFLTYGGSSLLSSFVLLAVLQVCSEDFIFEEIRHEKK